MLDILLSTAKSCPSGHCERPHVQKRCRIEQVPPPIPWWSRRLCETSREAARKHFEVEHVSLADVSHVTDHIPAPYFFSGYRLVPDLAVSSDEEPMLNLDGVAPQVKVVGPLDDDPIVDREDVRADRSDEITGGMQDAGTDCRALRTEPELGVLVAS